MLKTRNGATLKNALKTEIIDHARKHVHCKEMLGRIQKSMSAMRLETSFDVWFDCRAIDDAHRSLMWVYLKIGYPKIWIANPPIIIFPHQSCHLEGIAYTRCSEKSICIIIIYNDIYIHIYYIHNIHIYTYVCIHTYICMYYIHIIYISYILYIYYVSACLHHWPLVPDMESSWPSGEASEKGQWGVRSQTVNGFINLEMGASPCMFSTKPSWV
jgi:hypothetical protein